jgi:hypothetical protein
MPKRQNTSDLLGDFLSTLLEASFLERLVTIEGGRASAAGTSASAIGANAIAIPGDEPNLAQRPAFDSLEVAAPQTTIVQPRRATAKTIRLRDKEHRRFVAAQPCVVCGRTPAEAHHIRFAQPER